MTPKTLMSIEEFTALPDDGMLHELNDGELITTPPPKPRHGKCQLKLCSALLTFAGSLDLGEVYTEAGYRLNYSSQGRTAKITSVDTSSALEWRGGELAYVWEPLGAVVEDLNRYSEHKVIIKDPAIAELRFTGTVFTASLADWVKAVEQAYRVRADSTANGDIVLVDRR